MRTFVYIAAAALFLLSACETGDRQSRSERLAAESIDDSEFLYARRHLDDVEEPAVKDSLTQLLAQKRRQFIQERKPQLQSAADSIMSLPHMERGRRSLWGSSWVYLGGRADSSNFYPQVMVWPGRSDPLDAFDLSIKAEAEDLDAIQVECGDWKANSEEGLWIEKKVIERIATQENCTLWLKPYGSQRPLTPHERRVAGSVIDLYDTLREMAVADALDPGEL